MTDEVQEGETMVQINSAIPGLAKVMTADELIESLSKYGAEQPDDMPEGGADLMNAVVSDILELQASIQDLNDSFRENCEGIMMLTGPEFRFMTVEFVTEEIPLMEALENFLGEENV